MEAGGTKQSYSAEAKRLAIAAGSFVVMLAGIAQWSIPASMVVGGGLLLSAAIYGQFRQPPKEDK